MFGGFEPGLGILYWYGALRRSFILLIDDKWFLFVIFVQVGKKRILRFIVLVSVWQKLYLDGLLDENLRDFDDAEILMIVFGGRKVNELFWVIESLEKVVFSLFMLIDKWDGLRWAKKVLFKFWIWTITERMVSIVSSVGFS